MANTAPKSDTTKELDTVNGMMGKLETAAEAFRNNEQDYLFLIILLPAAASFLTIGNMVFKQNVDALGGWVPFCLAATALTAFTSVLAAIVKSDEPRLKKEKCFEALGHLRGIKRKLEAPQLTERAYQSLQSRIDDIQTGVSEYLLPPRRSYIRAVGLTTFALIMVAYFAWVAWANYEYRERKKAGKPAAVTTFPSHIAAKPSARWTRSINR